VKTDMPDYYAKRAQEYERIYEKPERQEDITRVRGLLSDAFAGMRVLDVSCGTAFWTSAFSSSAKSVVGCDINEEVLDIARQKAWHGAHVNFIKADSYVLPKFERSFDAAFSGFWWSHIPKKKLPEFLIGLHRCLEGGAKVVFIDNRYVEGSSTPLSRTSADGDTFQTRRLSDGSVHEVLKNFPTSEELLESVASLSERATVETTRYFWILTYFVR
jgi:ubiquinone/menaquinone biosynthesis C-methylase UbiE